MAQFTHQDLQAFSTCLRALYTRQPGLPFATQALRALSALIPADLCFYVTIDFHTPHASLAVMEPTTLTFPGDNRDVVATVIREHPIVQYWHQSGTGHASMLADFVSRRHYHHLMLYQTYYRPLAIEYQLGVRIPSSPRYMIAVVLNRPRRAFSARDCYFLDLLQDHLWHAVQTARALTRLQQGACRQEPEGAWAQQTLLMQPEEGHPWRLTAPAWAVVQPYVDVSPRQPQRLPDTLQRWMLQQQAVGRQEAALQRPRAPLCYTRPGRRLLVRYLEDEGIQPALLLEEQHTGPAPAALQALGLTPRQAEVLFWVTQGKTNQDIAVILQARPGTIKKHLEQIYTRLGVENRTAAARCAMERLGGWDEDH
jgi:DNA-binding CsgD family transcriptional regulator